MSFYCYLLESQNKTYIGATVDPNRRLQQHNGEKSGGARATRGKVWRRVLYVSGFPDWTAALQFEWAWKFHSRKQRGSLGRIEGLLNLLRKGKSTSQSLPYIYWNNVLSLHMSTPNLTHLEKIESSDLHLVEQAPTNTEHNLPKTFRFLPFPNKMSVFADVSSTSIAQLASLVETLSADMTHMKTQLANLLATANTAVSEAQPKKPRKAVLKAPAATEAPATTEAPAADAPTKKPRGRKPKAAEAAAATDAPVADAPAAEAPKKARKPYQRKPKAAAETTAPAEVVAETAAPAEATAEVTAAVKKPRGRKPNAAKAADAPAAEAPATTPQATAPATEAPPAPKKVVRKPKAKNVTPVPTAEVIA